MPDSIESILAVTEDPAYVRVCTARVLLRQDLATRVAELDAELGRAVEADNASLSLGDVPTSPEVAERLVALEDEIEAAKVDFRFGSIGKRAWADLIAQHPPTKDQLRERRELDHNPLTFPAAAIAASCLSHPMTYEQAQRLEQSVNLAQWQMLWGACLNANVRDDVPKSLAAGTLRRLNGASGRQPTITASPVPSSSGAS